MSRSNPFKVRRVFEPASTDDGIRVLVDRLWPRGLKKEAARLDDWPKNLTPSPELRRWFNHEPAKWEKFVQRYHEELDANPQGVQHLLDQSRKGNVTLLFAAHDPEHNNAVALQRYLQNRVRSNKAKPTQ